MVWLIFRERNKGLAYYTMGDAIPFEEGGIYTDVFVVSKSPTL
jgi:hypothetical protein